MAKIPEFQRKQYEFAAHIRNPEKAQAPPGIEDRRMAIYRELFFNNLLKLLSGTFPVLKKLHADDKWRSMVRQFMIQYRSQTPYFLQIPREFLDFLGNHYEAGDDDFPFLNELAHYEWAELALSVSEDSNDDLDVEDEGDLLSGIPVKSRLAWAFAYHFPVHRIAEDFLPEEPDDVPTFIALFRKADDELGFLELNPVTARLLELIEANDTKTGREILTDLAEEISYPDVDAMIAHGHDAMEQMRSHEIILGTRRSL